MSPCVTNDSCCGTGGAEPKPPEGEAEAEAELSADSAERQAATEASMALDARLLEVEALPDGPEKDALFVELAAEQARVSALHEAAGNGEAGSPR